MSRSVLIFVVALACASGVHADEAPVFHVATDGNDAWSGLLPDPAADGSDGPFATLTRARDALRAAATDGQRGGMVYVRGGAYHLDEPLTLGPEDSGAEGQPRVWQAYAREEARLIAGRQIAEFSPWRDEILVADLSDVPLPGGRIPDLFFNGARQPLARWPNAGEGDLPGGGWAFVTAGDADAPRRAFRYAGDRPAAWAEGGAPEVSIWPNYNWWQTIAPIASVDTEARRVTLAEDLPYTIERGRRFFFRNVLEELDQPGEWYHDAEANRLYFWPPGPVADAEVLAAGLENAVVVEEARHVFLIGFTIEATRGIGVVFRRASESLLARSTIRNTHGHGVVVSGGNAVRVMGNDIHDTGRGGIVLEGGDRKTLVPGHHMAVNNHIHHFGRLWNTYQTGVQVAGVGNRVAHNLIHDAPHIAILLGGNDHLIEFNHIHHVCLEGADNGAFYMGRDWTQRGNLIRWNRFHDIYGFGLNKLDAGDSETLTYEAPHWAWGVYLDDCTSGTMIHGNLFYRVPLCGVMIGGGRDNRVKNNVFVDCVPALHIDARWDSYPWDLMHERLEAMDYKNPPYSERYPELLEMGDDPRRPANNRFNRNIVSYRHDNFRGLSSTAPSEGAAVVYNLAPFDPEHTRIDRNLIFHHGQPVRVHYSEYGQGGGGGVISWEEWRAKGFDENSVIDDPKFVNPDADDYALKHDSPAFDLGFEALPIHRMGLYDDEFRASWPPPTDTRRDGVALRQWRVEVPRP